MNTLLKKSAFISLELFLGFGLGILGSFLIPPIFEDFVRATSPPFTWYNDSPGYMFFMHLSFYLFMGLGIAIAGYFHFKTFNRLNEFRSAISWSFIGFIFFFFLGTIIQALTYTFLPENNTLLDLSVILPIFGAVIGFNFPAEE